MTIETQIALEVCCGILLGIFLAAVKERYDLYQQGKHRARTYATTPYQYHTTLVESKTQLAVSKDKRYNWYHRGVIAELKKDIYAHLR